MSETIELIQIERIQTMPQVRETIDEVALEGLALSLQEVGMLQPIRVRRAEDGLVIVDGERRYRAACRLGWENVPVIVEAARLDAAAIVQRQLIANCQRADLTPLEKARAIQRLIEAGQCNASEAAKALAMSSGMVSKLLAILTLPAAIQALIDAGRVPVSSALDLARITDPAKQAALAEQLASGHLTRDGLSGAVKAERRAMVPHSNATKPKVGRAQATLSGGRTVTVSGPELSLESFITWLEELLGKARKARPTGIELPTFLTMLRDQSRCLVEAES